MKNIGVVFFLIGNSPFPFFGQKPLPYVLEH